MSERTRDEVREHVLFDNWPPDSRQLLDWENPSSNVYLEADAIAGALTEHAFDILDQFRRESVATGATAGTHGLLPDWETALQIANSKVALTGTSTQRNAQVTARLREFGPASPTDILIAVQTITGPVAATLIETKRATLDAAIAVSFGAVEALPGFSASATTELHDNALASEAGLRFQYIIGGGNTGSFTIQITGPDGTSKQWSGAFADSGVYALFGAEFAGKQITGTWAIDIDNSGGVDAVELDGLSVLLIDGIGNSDGSMGLGGQIFEWSIVIDESVVRSTYDRAAVCAVIARWAPAHTHGRLALYQTTGALCAVADDTNAIADMCVCGA